MEKLCRRALRDRSGVPKFHVLGGLRAVRTYPAIDLKEYVERLAEKRRRSSSYISIASRASCSRMARKKYSVRL